jgi:sporulation protein YlmC with PRC-barrel domain
MRLTDDSLRNRVVVSSDGFALGAITKLVLAEDWRVHAVEIKLRRNAADRIGVRRSMFSGATLEIPTDVVQSIGDAVVLSVTADSLRHPDTAEHHPAAAPSH